MGKGHESVVVCCSAEEERRPGYTTGYQCRVCEHELQVSPFGLPQIERGAAPVCNPCGYEIIKRESRRRRLSIEASPVARAQAERAGRTLFEELRRRRSPK